MPTARMNKSSSALRLAATGWLVSRQCTRSAPSSFVPVGSVPGIRLENVQNALRWPPSGKRNGQTTNPGFNFKFGLSARRATSVPDTADWRRKLAASVASEPNLSRDPCGGRRRKLTQVAPTTAASPTGRSAGAHPEIMSQNARRSVARTAHARGRPTGTFSDCGLNAPIQDWNRLPRARRSTPTQRAGCGASAHADCPNGPASAVSSPQCCDMRQSYHDSFERGKRRSAALGRGSIRRKA